MTTSHPGRPERQRGADAARLAPPSTGPEAAVEPSPHLVRLLDEVRAHIATHVRRRRAEGASLERVLPEIWGLVQEAELLEAWPDPLGVLLGLVTQWAVEAYDEDPAPQNAASVH